MKHVATESFWQAYNALPTPARELADKSFTLLKTDPRHPSLQLKQIGKLWSVRVGLRYRALSLDHVNGIAWIWIGTHAEYDRKIR